MLVAFQMFSQSAGNKAKILVLDNLESIFDSRKLMDELADIIILLDDERYAKEEITILIVGVPDGVMEYFARTKSRSSVANRVQEVNKVGGLTREQAGQLALTGFELLGLRVLNSHQAMVIKHVHHVTLGVPQRLHEYCEFLAEEIKESKGRVFRKEHLAQADAEWWKTGFRNTYGVLKEHLNSRVTKVARKNQIIYVIGNSNKLQFDSGSLDALIRKEFPSTVPKTNMGIPTILTDLCSGAAPFLKRMSGTNEYCAADPLLLVCVRLMLYKDPATGSIHQRKFQR